MKLEVWGARGPGGAARGRATCCASLDLGGGRFVVFDAGTGAERFVAERAPRRILLLISHAKEAHVAGLRALDGVERAESFAGVEVEERAANHPDRPRAFRVSAGGRSVAYLPDHRLSDAPADLADFAADADILLHDGTHSTFEEALAFARRCGARRLVLTHLDGAAEDAELRARLAALGAGAAAVLGEPGLEFAL